jgi:hypothetical protein
MFCKQSRACEVTPMEQQAIALNQDFKFVLAEQAPACSSVFVIDPAAGSKENLPSSFPCTVAEVSILHIGRVVDMTETLQLKKLLPVKCS